MLLIFVKILYLIGAVIPILQIRKLRQRRAKWHTRTWTQAYGCRGCTVKPHSGSVGSMRDVME